ncbi:hypothetical protein I4R72_002377 [Salmonella enterica]|nr:hypothetical protein [Salmonella enterica]
MNFKKFLFRNSLNRQISLTPSLKADEEEFAEIIKNPAKISSKMVRKIVLNGLLRLEKEGADPFSNESVPSSPTKPKSKKIY